MNTLVVGEHPFMTDALARRRALGHDHRDEMWEGVYHVVPHASAGHASVAAQVIIRLSGHAGDRGLVPLGEFNLGAPQDFRVPDAGWLAAGAQLELYVPTAVAVLEVLSPGDETWAKFPFYAAQGVTEILVADLETHTVSCWACSVHASDPAPGDESSWRQMGSSEVFDCTMAWLAEQIRWP